MPSTRYVDLQVVVPDGAVLMSSFSFEKSGARNYTEKRDWRRDLDREKRAEGEDYFWGNPDIEIDGQPFPGRVAISDMVRVGDVVTVTTSEAHRFQDGETVIISGSNPSGYDGSFPVTIVDDLTFSYEILTAPGLYVGGATGQPDEVLQLVTESVRPNGKKAVVVGSKRRLYRFTSLEDGGYTEFDGLPAEYWATSGPDTPYVLTDQGEWMTIGWGFSTAGNRWEHVSINGYLCLNNGADLPCSYRWEEQHVVPIYELREQGVAAVGTIAEHAGCLMAFDITEIDAEEIPNLFDFVGKIQSGNVLALQTGNTVTVPVDFFTPNLVNWQFEYSDGVIRNIAAVVDERTVTLDGAALTVDGAGLSFTLRPRAQQNGSLYSGIITADLPDSGPATVTASGAIFTLGMVGDTIRFANGFETTITAFIGPTQVTVADNAPETIDDQPFWVIDAGTSFVVISTSFFTADMVGRKIIWESGEVRTITAYVSPTQVEVDADLTVALGPFGLNNPETYARYTQTQFTDRIQYKAIWSMIGEPRRFASVVPGRIESGSIELVLDYPVQSFEAGQQILISGAGQSGGNLIATIVFVAAEGKELMIDTPALTTTTTAFVQQLDSVGSIVGSAELQDDSSGILKALRLDKTLIIYKATSIFTALFTGVPESPFQFDIVKDVPLSGCLYYRNTLCLVGGRHVYAGRNNFYEFDLGSRLPSVFQLAEACKNIFYGQPNVKLSRSDDIFVANNSVTNEMFFVYPSSNFHKALRYDYEHETFSTTSMEITAGGTVSRPATQTVFTPTENWFVMGSAHGVLTIYGAAVEAQSMWGGEKEIFYRRYLYPYSEVKIGYDSALSSGMAAFGDQFNEKDLNAYVVLLGTNSPNAQMTVELLGCRNVSEAAISLGSRTFTIPTQRNLLPCFFRQNYFQDKITVTGVDNPVEYVGKIFNAAPVNSRSTIRNT